MVPRHGKSQWVQAAGIGLFCPGSGMVHPAAVLWVMDAALEIARVFTDVVHKPGGAAQLLLVKGRGKTGGPLCRAR